jgi:hypothetical protein
MTSGFYGVHRFAVAGRFMGILHSFCPRLLCCCPMSESSPNGYTHDTPVLNESGAEIAVLHSRRCLRWTSLVSGRSEPVSEGSRLNH